jgi:hypothetical protein
MNRDDVIRMAREAGFTVCRDEWVLGEMLERFAAIITTANREAFAKIQFESLLQSIRIEREACERLCEDMAKGYEERAGRPKEDRDINPEVARIASMTCAFVGDAIRARGDAE